jgi:hypothetical protein
MHLPQPASEADAPERLECKCSRHPLLARMGRYQGRPFIWVRRTKQRVVIVDIVVTTGDLRIKCRECNRWWRFVIRDQVLSEVES